MPLKDYPDFTPIFNENEIKGFFYEYRWLSNYHICPVMYEEVIYPSSENAYQAAKTNDLPLRKIFTEITPKESKKLGNKIGIPEKWNDIRYQVMYDILYDKFTRNEDLKQMLIKTGNKYLEETVYWSDIYWAKHYKTGIGESKLGEILMKIREKINQRI